MGCIVWSLIGQDCTLITDAKWWLSAEMMHPGWLSAFKNKHKSIMMTLRFERCLVVIDRICCDSDIWEKCFHRSSLCNVSNMSFFTLTVHLIRNVSNSSFSVLSRVIHRNLLHTDSFIWYESSEFDEKIQIKRSN